MTTVRTLRSGILLATLTIGFSGVIEAADRKTLAMPPAAKAFLHDAALDGMAEVQLGKLAESKATNAGVKAFAVRMADDHTQANQTLAELASQKNMTLPEAVDPKHKAVHDRLANLGGAAFDKAYMTEMTTGHVHAVEAFKQASASSDPDVAAFASKTLPTLQGHLKEARRVKAEVDGARTARDPDVIRTSK